LDNRAERGFPQRPHASSSNGLTHKNSDTPCAIADFAHARHQAFSHEPLASHSTTAQSPSRQYPNPNRQSPIANPQSSIAQSSINNRQSNIRQSQIANSPIVNLQSAIVNQHQLH
jgi:hypothetical protein